MQAKKGVIFVFGSNLAGRHGAGSALHARLYKGAKYGQANGRQGNSYAIPTKDYDTLTVLPLERIKIYVDDFIQYAKDNPSLTFVVVRIGCGLAGYTDEQMAPLFRDCPPNVNLQAPWKRLLAAGRGVNSCDAVEQS